MILYRFDKKRSTSLEELEVKNIKRVWNGFTVYTNNWGKIFLADSTLVCPEPMAGVEWAWSYENHDSNSGFMKYYFKSIPKAINDCQGMPQWWRKE